VHHHGVDLSEFGFQSDGRPPDRILAIGGFSEYKGFDYLLRAGKELMIRGVDFKIELVGDGKEATLLKTLAHNLRIADRVSFQGWQNPANIPTLIRGATVLVHPSSRLADGVPNVIKESMAAGTPVIASRVAGIPEVLGDGRYGLLVPPKDARALANAIETLLGSQEQRLKYSHAARRYVEQKFDLWRNGQQLAEVLYATARERREDSIKCQ
jgi:glycosyltransferase involved in cell wall biosynthesis